MDDQPIQNPIPDQPVQNPSETGKTNPERVPQTSNNRKFILVSVLLIIIFVVGAFGVYLYLIRPNFSIDFFNNTLQFANLSTSTSSATTLSETSGATQTVTPARTVPVAIDSAVDAQSACDNNCKELGYVSGTCVFGNDTNLTCTNSTSSLSGTMIKPRQTTDWCAFFTVDLAYQSSGCCCYQ